MNDKLYYDQLMPAERLLLEQNSIFDAPAISWEEYEHIVQQSPFYRSNNNDN